MLGGGIAVKRVLMMTGQVVLTGSVCPIRLKSEARRDRVGGGERVGAGGAVRAGGAAREMGAAKSGVGLRCATGNPPAEI